MTLYQTVRRVGVFVFSCGNKRVKGEDRVGASLGRPDGLKRRLDLGLGFLRDPSRSDPGSWAVAPAHHRCRFEACAGARASDNDGSEAGIHFLMTGCSTTEHADGICSPTNASSKTEHPNVLCSKDKTSPKTTHNQISLIVSKEFRLVPFLRYRQPINGSKKDITSALQAIPESNRESFQRQQTLHVGKTRRA